MNKFWKNVLNMLLIIAISGGVAAGITAYVLMNKGMTSSGANQRENVFDQPVQLTAFGKVAAENNDFTYAAEKTVNAVVHVKVMTTVSGRRYIDPFEYYFGYRDRDRQREREQQPVIGSGSGVIISTDGYIITNNHVVAEADSINVTLNDKRSFNAKLIGKDPTTDIALIKIEADNLNPISFGDSEKLKVGEWVLAVGNPFNLTSTVTAGIVSAKGRSFMTGEEDDKDKVMAFIQTDAAVNSGNSGGALVNTQGELVGINTAIISQSGMFAGYSFAVPINIAGKVVSDLKQYGSFQRAMLGITMTDPQSAKSSDDKIKELNGAYVVDFAMRSSAKEAGIEKGDVITHVNETPVTSPTELQEQITKYQLGDKVKIKLDRYGTKKEITVELRNAQGNTEITKIGDSAKTLGAAFKSLSDNQKREYGVSYGIQVDNISKGKIQDCGIRRGFIIMLVNEQKIQTPEEFFSLVDKILQGSTEEKGLLIKGFYPNSGATRHYAIDLID